MADYILHMKDIDKVFPGSKVLNKACLEVKRGEIMGLIGENGAGKSTILKVLTGIYQSTAGEIDFKGRKVSYANIEEAQRDGIAFMHQELNVFDNLTVAENIFLNRLDYCNKFGFVNKKRAVADAKKILLDLGSEIAPDALGSELGVHEQQIVEIAKAMSMKAELIIMDEPTAALPENEVQKFFKFIRRLNTAGITIIYVSHKMVEIKEICNRVTILRNGETISVVEMSETKIEDMVNLMVGRSLKDYYVHTPAKRDELLLAVNCLKGAGFDDISFKLMKSEVLGIYGLAGSGTREFAECLFGNHKPYSGEVFLDGKRIEICSIYETVKNKIAYVPIDRKEQGFVKGMSVYENISMSSASEHRKGLFVDWNKNKEICVNYVKSLLIKTASIEQHVDKLSGGNQQKVVISKWLAAKPKVLILNEPTRGVDVGAKAEIYSLIDQLVKQDLGIILISSEAPEILGMTDRVMIMHRGRFNAELSTKDLQQDTLLKYASGGLG